MIEFAGPYRIAEIVDGRHRTTRAPGSDVSDLPKDMQDKIAAEWTDEVLAAYREATKEEPPPLPVPDPIRLELDALRKEVDELKALVSRDTLTTSTKR